MTFFSIEFKAVTICNMNQAKRSAVRGLVYDSVEYSLVQSLCTQAVDDNVTNSKSGKWQEFRRLLIKVYLYKFK